MKNKINWSCQKGASLLTTFNLSLYLLVLFQQQLPVMSAKYYIQLFHQQLNLLIFDNWLPHFELLLQIFHQAHLFWILMYLNHLVLYKHNYLNFLFLIEENLLLNMLVFQIFCQNVPMLVLKKLVLHNTKPLNFLLNSIV